MKQRSEIESIERVCLTPAEAAVSIGISRSLIYPLISRQELGSIKIGKRRLVPRTAIADFVKRRLGPACGGGAA
jgi:excisionase family DNA binding protein